MVGVSGQRRYREAVLHRLAIVDVAQRAGLTLEEIRGLTGPQADGHRAGEHLRELAARKLPEIEALIARAEAVSAGWRWPRAATSRRSTSAISSSTGARTATG